MEAELSALKVADLQAQLKELGLNVKGKKAELVARLLEAKTAKNASADASGAPAAPAAAEPAVEVAEEAKPAGGELKRPREEEPEVALAAVPVAVATAPASEARAAKSETTPVTGSVVVVTGLVRPFTEDQAKEFVSGGATLVSWKMPVSRSWALAAFETAEGAANAVQRLNGVVWPAKNASALKAAVYDSVEIAMASVAPPTPVAQRKQDAAAEKKEEKKEAAESPAKEEESSKRHKKGDEANGEAKAAAAPAMSTRLQQTKTKPVLFYTHK